VITKVNEELIAENDMMYLTITYSNGATVRKSISTQPVMLPESEPTQLDRIEAAVTASKEQIAQEARDAYTLELIEGGVIA